MKSPLQALYDRQLKNWDGGASQKAWRGYFFNKLNLETTLKCHGGCVNCLQWSKCGRLLLSGSDDKTVCVWEPLQHKLLAQIPSHHGENIFSVKFVNRDKQVISGAGDGEVRHLDIAAASVLSAWRCHRHRVKRCCTVEDDDNLVISSSEDGTARQFDIREGHTCSSTDSGCSNTLIRLENCSIKSINSNPVRTHLVCVGTSDDIARVYDRRMLSLTHAGSPDSTPELARYLPGHLAYPTVDEEEEENRFYSGPSITWCTFDPTGNYLLCNMGGEQIYLYDVEGKLKVIELEKMASDVESPSVPLSPSSSVELDSDTTVVKEEGNSHYKQKDYHRAITAYSKCLARYPHSVVLLNNRAQALLKREWKGDQYAALRDSSTALDIDPDNEKAHFRQIQSLHAMKYSKLAKIKLKHFQTKFSRTPETDSALKTISDEISTAIENNRKDPPIRPDLSDCSDYVQRYTGHCNCKTDIKEANFFGPDQEYIMAGSDDKHIFFWDRNSCEVLRVYKGDHSLVNCVQPNPHLPIIASSGLEKVVKLWSPQSQDPNVDDDNPREILMNSDEISLNEIVRNNQSQMDNRESIPTFAMIQNAMLGMVDPDSLQNSCNPS